MATNTWADSNLDNRITGERWDYDKQNGVQDNIFYLHEALENEHGDLTNTTTGANGVCHHKIIYSNSDNSVADPNDSIFINLQITAVAASITVIDTRYNWLDRYMTWQGLSVATQSYLPGGTNDEYCYAGVYSSGTNGIFNYGTPVYSAGYMYSGVGTNATAGAGSVVPNMLLPSFSVENAGAYITVNTSGNLVVYNQESDEDFYLTGLLIAGPKQNDHT
jgi:hypothetical protein